MTTLAKGNAERRDRAARADRPTFLREFVDAGPGCTTCGEQISGWQRRTCGCPGASWTYGMYGWNRHEPAVPGPAGEKP